MGILFPPATKPNASLKCSVCDRWYVYRDSLERHMRDKHGTTYEQEQATRCRERDRLDAQRSRRAAKHRELHFAVVKTALDFWREASFVMIRGSAKPFASACAALEKFETGGKKR